MNRVSWFLFPLGLLTVSCGKPQTHAPADTQPQNHAGAGVQATEKFKGTYSYSGAECGANLVTIRDSGLIYTNQNDQKTSVEFIQTSIVRTARPDVFGEFSLLHLTVADNAKYLVWVAELQGQPEGAVLQIAQYKAEDDYEFGTDEYFDVRNPEVAFHLHPCQNASLVAGSSS